MYIQLYILKYLIIQCGMTQYHNRFLYKNTNRQQMHKERFIVNRYTLLHVSTLLGHLQGELSVTVTLVCTLQLNENVLLTVYCVVFGGVNSQAGTTDSSRLQYTVHSQQHILTQL
jgi:hypothetical protein